MGISHLVLLYAIVTIAILLAYHRTRLFPVYILKTAWTGFTILAFVWVLAMSGGESKEYIQNPTGPMEIFLGGVETRDGKEVVTGYPGMLQRWTGTRPHWVLAMLFTNWVMWGLLRKQTHRAAPGAQPAPAPKPVISLTAGDVFPLDYTARHGRDADLDRIDLLAFKSIRALCVLLMFLALTALLFWGAGLRDTIAYGIGVGFWVAIAAFATRAFHKWGHWMLLGMLLVLLLPLIVPIMNFNWSRYAHFSANYQRAWNQARVGQYFMNSLIVTITTVAMTTLFGAMAAYTLARQRLAAKGIVYAGIILAISIPGILIQVPLFLLIKDWGFDLGGYRYSFMDSRLGLAIIYSSISLPFTIFVLTGFFRTLPSSLGEAACIDGCGRWRTFTQIYLPLAMPGIATTGIFNFLGAWNEFNLGMIFMSNPNFKTLPIGMYELQTAIEHSAEWSLLFAGIILLCLPTFLIFVFLQERIVAGLTAGGLKG